MRELCRLKEIFRAIYVFETTLKKRFRLSLNEALALCALEQNEKNSRELAQEIGISFSRMSRVLGSLEQKGLIKRTFGADDRRKMIFSLSPEGRRKISELHDHRPELPLLP
ncbi:MAG TPA: winged helix DNA-binding protein [bacterium]|nr:winged helix DNA-binding protein [bacterium]